MMMAMLSQQADVMRVCGHDVGMLQAGGYGGLARNHVPGLSGAWAALKDDGLDRDLPASPLPCRPTPSSVWLQARAQFGQRRGLHDA
jgi:hypothetical protein